MIRPNIRGEEPGPFPYKKISVSAHKTVLKRKCDPRILCPPKKQLVLKYILHRQQLGRVSPWGPSQLNEFYIYVYIYCWEPTRESPPITRLCGRVLVGKASQNSRGAPLGLPDRIPQNQSLPTLLLCALTLTLRGAVPHHHLSLSEKELTYSSS